MTATDRSGASGFTYRFREPTGPPERRGRRPPAYRREVSDSLLIERDVPVELRGGVVVHVDLFRPADEAPAPPLFAWGPYGKHADLPVTQLYPDGDVAVGQLSEHTGFESPDPVFWVGRGTSSST